MSRRLLRWLIIGSVALLAMLVVLAAVLAYRPQSIAEAVRERMLPTLSKRLGREITVGRIEPVVFPLPHARLEGLRLAGVAGGVPLLEAREVSFGLELWPLLRSLGKDVRLRDVEVDGLELNLVRDSRGVWNHEGIASDGAGSPRAVAISELRVRGGTVRVVEGSAPGGPAAVVLRDLELLLGIPGAEGPRTVELLAALASENRNLRLELTASPRESGPVDLVGSFEVDRSAIDELKPLLPEALAAMITGGAVSVRGRVTTEGAAYLLEADANTDRLALRGGPGQVSFHASGRVDPRAPLATSVRLERVSVQGLGATLNGSANVRVRPMRARFALEGQRLDLDTLMASLPASPSTASAPGGAVLSESLRSWLGAADIKGSLTVRELVAGRLEASELRVEASLVDGELLLNRAHAGLYGGFLDASGSRVDLARAEPRWSLAARLANVELGRAMQQVTGAQPLRGWAGGRLALTGVGTDWARLRSNLAGHGDVELREGELTSVDLSQQLGDAVAQTLRSAGSPAVGGSGAAAVGSTPLGDVTSGIQVSDGWIDFARPVRFDTDLGPVTLEGRVGLDHRLALDGVAALSPEFVSRVSGGLRPSGPVNIPFTLGGNLETPTVGTTSEQIAQALANALYDTSRREGGALERRTRERLEDEVRRRSGAGQILGP